MEEEKNKCSEIARYILYLLSLQPYITMYWGIEDIETFMDSVEFRVDGSLFKGNVRITFITGADLFQVSLYDEDGSTTKHIDDIYTDELVETVDSVIENENNVNYLKAV